MAQNSTRDEARKAMGRLVSDEQWTRRRLHQIAEERQQLEAHLLILRAKRNRAILDFRNDLPQADMAVVLGLNRATVSDILNRELKNEGMGAGL